MSGGSGLKAKVLQGGIWLGSGSVSEQLARFARNMILTRLLAPAAFGTMAIVLSVCSAMHAIMDIGVREALIQNPRGGEDRYVGAAWWMAFGRGLTFWALLSLFAPLVARFYGDPELTALFRVAAVGVLLEGAMSARAYAAIKSMKFRGWAAVNHGGAICGVLITIALGFSIRGVWALALGYCSESLGRLALSYILYPYRPFSIWDNYALRDLWRYSRKAFGLSVLNLVFARSDIFVLAKLCSPAALGVYTMAVYLVQTPATFLMSLLGQTLLPTYAHVQGDYARTNKILVKVTSAILLVGIPPLLFVVFFGRSVLTLMYGSRYAGGAAPFVLAFVVCLLNVINGQITSVFFGQGQPHLHRRCVLIMACTTALLMYPLVRRVGFVGAQLTGLIAISAGLAFQVARVRRLTGLALPEYANGLYVAVLASPTVILLCLATRESIPLIRPLPTLLIGILACILAYCVSLVLLCRGPQGRRRLPGLSV